MLRHNMRMSKLELHNEYLYTSTMAHVKQMVSERLIAEGDYWALNAKMKEKYRPISDGLISEKDMIFVKKT